MPFTASATPDQSATTAVIKTTIDSSKKIGEYKGNAYYFKPAAPGTGQIFRVPIGDSPTTFAMVGLIVNGKYASMDPKEKSDFFALVTDTLASDIAGGSAPTQQAVAPQVTVQPVGGASAASANAGTTIHSAKASRGEDSNTPTVEFDNDPKFHNDVVAWRKGHIELSRNGSKFADLGYTGGGYGEGAAKKGLKIGLNEVMAGATFGRSPLSLGWEITTTRGVANTSVMTAASANGIYQKDPYGIEGEAVAATEIFRQQLDQSFTYPGYDKLRKIAGLAPDTNTSTSQH